jgi:hypothetical protein
MESIYKSQSHTIKTFPSCIYRIISFITSEKNHTMSLNVLYIVLFKNPRDANQGGTLARQLHPDKGKFMLEAFKYATEKSYGYLLIDLKPGTDKGFREQTFSPMMQKHFVYVLK